MITPGRWADLTVMDVDPLVVGASDAGWLLGGSNFGTIVAGRVAHAADALGKASGK